MTPPAPGEQVDRGRQEGQQHGDQHQLDRPALDHARADVDVRRRPAEELEPLVERPQQVLRCSSDLPQPRRVEGVVGGAGRPVARSRDRDGGDST